MNEILTLKELREQNDLSQTALANLLGYSRQRYNMIEMCKRKGDLDFWLAIQKLYNLTDMQVGALFMWHTKAVQEKVGKSA